MSRSLDAMLWTDLTSRRRALALAAILSAFAVILIRTSWLCDDAYITLRTVDNAIHGLGFRWNGDERVQTYTHPLWMLLLAAAAAVTRETYFTSMAVGAICSMVAVWWSLTRVAASLPQMVLVGLVFLGAKSFADYSTSGLENPLTHLLLVAFWIACAGERSRARGLPILFASLLLITRQDLLWLVSPLLIATVWAGPRPSLRRAALAVLPLVLWEAFSLVYYGFALPNTAYAKLKTGIPESELVRQGFRYLSDSLHRDPLTLTVIACGTIASLAGRTWQARAVGIGVLIHVAYMLSVGGDFMSGRFFTVPLALTLLFLMSRPWRVPAPVTAGAAVAIGVLAWMPAVPNIVSGRDYAFAARPPIVNGIADERTVYFQMTGLIRHECAFKLPITPQGALAQLMVGAGQRVATRDQIGFFGFFAGPTLHVVDWLGLGDVLMARLPSKRPWSIGHFTRDLPPGYIDTLRTGQPHIQDPGLREYYAELELITRGPIVSRARAAAILRMNLGRDEKLLEPYWRAHLQ